MLEQQYFYLTNVYKLKHPGRHPGEEHQRGGRNLALNPLPRCHCLLMSTEGQTFLFKSSCQKHHQTAKSSALEQSMSVSVNMTTFKSTKWVQYENLLVRG